MMLPISTRRRLAAVSLLLCLCLWLASAAGCGGDAMPPLGKVSGLVTLDGQPLPAAHVSFVPASGIQSYGFTDAQGRYVLSYSGKKGRGAGALVGQHRVMISTGDAQGNRTGVPPPALPPCYNTQTTLTADVKLGQNEIDFALKSH